MEKKKLVIFDFDGVLVNTTDLTFALHKKANPGFTKEIFQSFEEGNFHENYWKAVEEGRHVHPERFFEDYGDGIIHLSTHDVINHLITDLFQKYELIVCSSMESRYIDKKLTSENIRNNFSEILGMDVHRSKVVKINKALHERGILPTDAIFITDTIGDIREGRECGVSSIGVTWGMQNRTKLESENPFAVVDTVQDLEQAIERFFLH